MPRLEVIDVVIICVIFASEKQNVCHVESPMSLSGLRFSRFMT